MAIDRLTIAVPFAEPILVVGGKVANCWWKDKKKVWRVVIPCSIRLSYGRKKIQFT